MHACAHRIRHTWFLALIAVTGACTDAPAADPESTATTASIEDLANHVPGDYEWDNDSDLVYQQDQTAFIKFHLTGQFEPYEEETNVPVPYGPVDKNWRLAAGADLNGDERPDFVFQNTTSSRIVAWHMFDLERISGGFTSPAGPEDANDRLICSAYFNDDHQADLVFQNQVTGEISVWVMNPSQPMARWSRQVITSGITGFSPSSFQLAGCGDFSGEGLADLVLRDPGCPGGSGGRVLIANVQDFRVREAAFVEPIARNCSWTLGAVGDLDRAADIDGHFELVWQRDYDLKVEAWKMQYQQILRTVVLMPSTPPDQMPPKPWRLVGPM